MSILWFPDVCPLPQIFPLALEAEGGRDRRQVSGDRSVERSRRGVVAATLLRATGVAERAGPQRSGGGLGAARVQVSTTCTGGSGSRPVGDTLWFGGLTSLPLSPALSTLSLPDARTPSPSTPHFSVRGLQISSLAARHTWVRLSGWTDGQVNERSRWTSLVGKVLNNSGKFKSHTVHGLQEIFG